MSRTWLLAPTLFLVACASTTVPPPVPANRDPWTRVTALERGARVVVMVDCEAPAACQGLGRSLIDGERVEGALSEVAAASVLVRPDARGASPVPVARDIIEQLFLVKPGSHQEGVLIGSAIGFAFCAIAGLYDERADLVFAGMAMYTGVCVGGGAGIGYLADRDPPTLVLIYEQAQAAARR